VSRYRRERLSDVHDRDAFDCGVPSLNDWLTRQALRAQSSDTARSYVWVGEGSVTVSAYYALAPTEVRRTELTGSVAGGISLVPGYLLARLALDRSLHGDGLGSWLLYSALEAVVHASHSAGGRIVAVDAIDDRAAAFYAHHGFHPIKNNPHRLVMKMSSARAILDQTPAKPR
jgi:GNAT superfamily N-acetyltransferase